MSVVNRALQKIRHDKQGAAGAAVRRSGGPGRGGAANGGAIGQPLEQSRWRDYMVKAGTVLLVVATAGVGWWFWRDDKDRVALVANRDSKPAGAAGEAAVVVPAQPAAAQPVPVAEGTAISAPEAAAVAVAPAQQDPQQPAAGPLPARKKAVRLTADELFAQYEQKFGKPATPAAATAPAIPVAAKPTAPAAAPAASIPVAAAAVIPVVASASLAQAAVPASVAPAATATMSPASMAAMTTQMAKMVPDQEAARPAPAQGLRMTVQAAGSQPKKADAVALPDEFQQARSSIRVVQVSKLVRDIQQAITLKHKEVVEKNLRELETVRGDQDPFVLNLWAYWWLVQEDYGRAEPVLQRILRKKAHDLEASINMVVLEVKTRQFEAARSRLSALLELYPADERLRQLQQSLP
ncbi:MAG: tetratricopeptide repeat protein [Magnetococcales bacterium]|nr:tetratricopeptide repeat protein [Magnetococcales bacterium]